MVIPGGRAHFETKEGQESRESMVQQETRPLTGETPSHRFGLAGDCAGR
jgi:hypothetical protein